jgi:hypothetical protein
MEIGILFTALQLTRMVAELTGIIESLGVKIDKLAASEFRAGLRALDQAQHTTGESQSLLREARGRFNKAVALEKHAHLAAAYLALAATHHQLGDADNCRATLCELLKVDFEGAFARGVAEFAKEGPKHAALVVARVQPLFFPFAYATEQLAKSALAEQERIRELKNDVREYLGQPAVE